MSNNFDDFFQDDDFDLDQPDFASDGFDDELPPDFGNESSGGGGASRTFVIIAALLAVVFVILVAVIVALFLGRSGDSCGERCQTATSIAGTNQAIETGIAASETALSTQSTATQEALVALQGTETAVAIVQATATQDALEQAIRQTETQVSVNATATQDQEFINRTATAVAQFTDTPAPVVLDPIEGTLRDANGQPLRGITICVFQDNGDGEFNPAESDSIDCSPIALAGVGGGAADATEAATEEVTEEATEEAAPTQASLSPLFQTATAAAGGQPAAVETEEAAPASDEGAAPAATPTGRPLNPIFATATANAAAQQGAGSTTDSSTDNSGLPPVPTPEESSFDPSLYVPVARQAPPGDDYIGEDITDANGRYSINVPAAGNYWIKVADQTLQVNITTDGQLIAIPREDGGAPIEIVVNIEGGAQPSATPGAISPIEQTATAIAEGRGGGIDTPTPDSGEDTLTGTDTILADTGLFDGKGGDVTAFDLLILALIGAVLVGIVFAARRMRSMN